MNLVMVELMSFSGYFSFKKIPLKLSHSSANISGEDERQWARFNIVIRMPHSFSYSFACDFRLRSLAIYGSVHSKRAPPPEHLSFFFGTAENVLRWCRGFHTKTPRWGFKKMCANAPPQDNSKIAFSRK